MLQSTPVYPVEHWHFLCVQRPFCEQPDGQMPFSSFSPMVSGCLVAETVVLAVVELLGAAVGGGGAVSHSNPSPWIRFMHRETMVSSDD